MELLRELAHERGRAVVLVTHDNRILEFADRTVHIEDGRIVAHPSSAHSPTQETAGFMTQVTLTDQPATNSI
jgi:putative ABC transport system ATP-binding protein